MLSKKSSSTLSWWSCVIAFLLLGPLIRTGIVIAHLAFFHYVLSQPDYLPVKTAHDTYWTAVSMYNDVFGGVSILMETLMGARGILGGATMLFSTVLAAVFFYLVATRWVSRQSRILQSRGLSALIGALLGVVVSLGSLAVVGAVTGWSADDIALFGLKQVAPTSAVLGCVLLLLARRRAS